MGTCLKVMGIGALAFVIMGLSSPANAIVTVTPSTDNSPFFPLEMPTGQFDERAFSSFEYFISSRNTDLFQASDQFIIAGEDRQESTSIFNDLGTVGDLSGTQFAFSIKHNISGGRNFTFSMNAVNSTNPISSTLCWGQGCAGADVSAETINGEGPFVDFNGLQLQVRAQNVPGSSATVQITGLSGVDLGGTGTNFFNETVTPSSPGTIDPSDLGRRGQWMIADDNDFTLNEWELTGFVTLSRPDDALADLTMVRLKVDLVRNPNLPFGALVPIPGAVWLYGTGVLVLFGVTRWRRKQAP